MSGVVNVTEENFRKEVLESATPVLVDFWASWCGHCSRLSPVFEELADEVGNEIKLVKVNVDENRALAQQHGIMGLPTMILFKNGASVERVSGFMPKAAIAAKFMPLL